MKIRVTRSFHDRATKRRYNVGGTYEGTDAKRIKELQAGGYLRPFPLPPARPAPPADSAGPEGAPETVETTAAPEAAAAETPETASAVESRPTRPVPRPRARAG